MHLESELRGLRRIIYAARSSCSTDVFVVNIFLLRRFRLMMGLSIRGNASVSHSRRRFGRRVLHAIVLVGSLFILGSEATAKDDWSFADTGNFKVFTNASPAQARSLVVRLEQFREHMRLLAGDTPFREPRVTVFIFNGDKSFRPYKPLYGGKPQESLAGIFTGLPDEAVIALSTEGDPRQNMHVILHEYVHYLMHARGYRLPLWLSEGLAELYSTMLVQKGELKIGMHIPYHILLLNRYPLMPLSQLFAVSAESPVYNEGIRQGIFYAQSWALLHYWNCGLAAKPGQSEKIALFFELMQTQLPPDHCMRQAFGMDLAEMEKELEKYVQGSKYMLKVLKVPEVDYAARVNFKPAEAFSQEIELLNLKWRIQRNGDATYQMLRLAELNPESPRPYELLAAMCMSEGDDHRAVPYWAEAARRKSTNAFIYQQLAQDVLYQCMNNVSLDFRLPITTTAELRAWLDHAVEMEPHFAEAWDWLALTEAFAPTMRVRVVNQILARHVLLKGRPRFIAAVAYIALRQKNTEIADRYSAALLKRPDVADSRGVISSRRTMAAAGGSPWMLNLEQYPDVNYIARAIQQHLKNKEPASPEVAEPVLLDSPDF